VERFVLGIDIGTTATKAVLIHPDGEIVCSASRHVDLHSPRPGWAEEDPRQWWDNVRALIPELTEKANIAPDRIAAVGVSGMVPTLICLDERGEPLRMSIQQNDARAVEEIEELKAKLPEDWVLETTGSAITQQSIAPKLMWLSRREPDVIRKTASICGSYDYIARRLTGFGSAFVEANWALESGLYDYRNGAWSRKIAEAAGIRMDWLGEVHPSHRIVGAVRGDHGTGLKDGTPVIAGSADHVASAFSAGLVEDGDLLIKLGGAGDILLTTNQPAADRRLYLDFHLIPGRYLINGCMASSGSVIRWFQRELAGGAPLDLLEREAEEAGAGADGLVLLPYFLGEKTPLQDPEARGMFVGLHLGHKRGHLYRAILEGIAFGFKHHIDTFRDMGFAPRRVRITNGGSRSRLWRQIVADITELPLESIIDHPGSSLGVAFAAGIGAGLIKDWSEIRKFLRVEERIVPDPRHRERYRTLYRVYRDIYPNLLEQQHILARLSRGGDGDGGGN